MSLKHDELQMFLKQLKLAEKTNTKLALLIRRTILNIQEEIDREWYKYQEKYHLDNEQMIKYFNKKMSQSEIEKYVETHQYALADFTSFKGKISRLVLLKNHIAYEMNYVQTESINHIEVLLKEVIENTYARNIYHISKEIGFELTFNKPSKEKIEKLLHHNWLDDGNWYGRVKNYSNSLKNSVEEVLTDGVMRGKSPQFMAQELQKISNIGTTSAQRIARTETSYFHNKTEMEQYKDLGIERYMWVSTLDSRVCQRASHKCGKSCAELDGMIFEVGGKDSPMPPDASHPNCRCCVVAYFDEETKNNLMRRAKTKDGEPVVFQYKNYEEWATDNL